MTPRAACMLKYRNDSLFLLAQKMGRENIKIEVINSVVLLELSFFSYTNIYLKDR